MTENLATVLPRMPTPRPTTPEMPNSVPKSLVSSEKSTLSMRSLGSGLPPFFPASALGACDRVADATVRARAFTRGFHRQSMGQSSSQSSPPDPPEPPFEPPPDPPPNPDPSLKLPPPWQVAGATRLARGACLARLETEDRAATRPGREREEMENECIVRVGVSECRTRDASSNRIVFARNSISQPGRLLTTSRK